MSDNGVKLLRTVTQFRKGMIGDYSSRDWCFAISSALCGYLSAIHGYHCELVSGKVGRYHHSWIQLKDGRIIDATADQFKNPNGESMPPVYIGKKPEWYKVKISEGVK
jgi:hypothetical protein